MFSKLHTTPNNPKHFIRMCFNRLKDEPSLREGNSLLRLVEERGSIAIFQCAYGFFIVSKEGRTSREFFSSLESTRNKIRSNFPL